MILINLEECLEQSIVGKLYHQLPLMTNNRWIEVRLWAMFFLIAMLLFNAGCRTSRRSQLQAVARDWFETIRASQVIPVYPMTEDLMPGDIFLVQMPIDKQQSLWKDGDYMSLDNHLMRLDPKFYYAFYDKSFLKNEVMLPMAWLWGPMQKGLGIANSPADGVPAIGALAEVKPSRSMAWMDAPGASFPSYTFKVKRGGGANIMVPISSVPVGMSLLGTDKAQVTVIIRNARTLGIDIASLYGQVLEWGAKRRDLLRCFGPGQGTKTPRNYLRVITRIYLAGEMEVGIQSEQSMAGGVDAGAPRPVDLLLTKTLSLPGRPDSTEVESGGADDFQTQVSNSGPESARIEDLQRNLNTLNTGLAAEKATRVVEGVAQLVPGGSIRVTMASSRAVSMSETFDSPLVIGYLGFDVPILEGGVLGKPIPTHSLITGVASNSDLDHDAIGEAASNFNDVLNHPQNNQVAKRIANKMSPDWGRLWDSIAKCGLDESIKAHFGTFCLAYLNAEPDGGMAVKNTRIRRLNQLIAEVFDEIQGE